MCGIIGIASNKSVTSNIIQSLKKLEYRGYDSTCIALALIEEGLPVVILRGRFDFE